MSLKTYHKKRNFNKTAEPKGKVTPSKKNLFIIQKHAASHLHYDFRLELNGVLLSWAVPKGPCLDPAVKRLAMHVEDHPVAYGSFEGIIPKGEYGGGTVMLWDKGKWYAEDENVVQAYKKGHLRFILKAEKLNGRWSLIKFKHNDDKSWFLVKGKDEYAQPLKEFDITLAEPNSVISGYDLDEIAANYKKVWTKTGSKKASAKTTKPPTKQTASPIKIKLDIAKSPFPTFISPQLATLVDKIPKGDNWLHEIKLDGYRILAFKKNNSIKLMSRNNKDWTVYFQNVVAQLKKLPVNNMVLDGEIVLLDERQHSNFQLLQNAIKGDGEQPFVYYIFDILYYEQYNLMHLPLIKRKDILHKVLSSTTDSILRFSDHILNDGDRILKNACKLGLEGIVSKQVNCAYAEKRSQTWVKSKCIKRQEFVIGGYTKPQGSRSHFGSLFLGVYNKQKELVFCGNVGTGFTQSSLKAIAQKLKQYQTTKNPFNSRPPGVQTAIWVEPKLVAEVEFSEWTSEGMLRHPSFQGLRTDKPAKSIIREKAITLKNNSVNKNSKPAKVVKSAKKKATVPEEFKLTHPDKVLYPEDDITKLNLVNYYQTVQDWILPYLINRPLTLVRCPQNYKQCFYQKHITSSSSDALYSIPIKGKEGVEDYIYIKDLAGLMALIQMSVLEIHPWGCTVDDIEHPDTIIFDLDPAPDVPWKKVVAAAVLIKKHLEKFKLKSFVKTTGGKGLHVVVPIQPQYTWDEVKNFAHVFVNFMVAQQPDAYISEMSKVKRQGKIFIDYLRNQRGATAVCAYSTRARAQAPVSVPLDWKELSNKREDTAYDIFSLPKRLKKLKKDPWKDFFVVRQSLRLDKL